MGPRAARVETGTGRSAEILRALGPVIPVPRSYVEPVLLSDTSVRRVANPAGRGGVTGIGPGVARSGNGCPAANGWCMVTMMACEGLCPAL
jgi:hypothetical protein